MGNTELILSPETQYTQNIWFQVIHINLKGKFLQLDQLYNILKLFSVYNINYSKIVMWIFNIQCSCICTKGYYNGEENEQPSVWREVGDGGHLYPEEGQTRPDTRPFWFRKDDRRFLGSFQEDHRRHEILAVSSRI